MRTAEAPPISPMSHDAQLGPSPLDVDTRQAEALFRRMEPGEDLQLPTNYLGEADIVVPSLVVESPKGHEARLIALHETDEQLGKFYTGAAGAKGQRAEQLADMAFGATVRMLDTNGAEGLHHLHGTNFPGTVYYAVRRGQGARPNVYMTQLGVLPGDVPVIAMVTATKDTKAEYKLFRYLGAPKRGYTP